MSQLSEQLRELLNSYEEAKGTEVYRVVETIFRDTLSLPKLLDEHEKLEREVERLKEFEWKYNDLCK